jgi:hypothetical protein
MIEVLPFVFFCVLLLLALLWPGGAILFSRKASWRGKSFWMGLWLLALITCFTVEYFHYRYLLESGYPRKLVSRDAFNGVGMAMLLGWAIYFLFRYRMRSRLKP